jgi:hypothetical protein
MSSPHLTHFHHPDHMIMLYDHAIPLLPNSIPVNSRPYRYSAHKDEIEKQVQELLTSGLITPSTKPFA